MAGTEHIPVGGGGVSPEDKGCSHSRTSWTVVNPGAGNEGSENRAYMVALNWGSAGSGLHSVEVPGVFLVGEGGNSGPAGRSRQRERHTAWQLREPEDIWTCSVIVNYSVCFSSTSPQLPVKVC